MLPPLTRPLRDSEHPAQLTLLLRSTPRSAGELFARMRALGLRRIAECRLTRNRNVMVSFGGVELRVHEGYLDAPDEILLAIVRFVEGTTRSERLRARRRLLEFPIETRALPARRRGGTHPDDRRFAERLTEWHDRYNREYFGGELRTLAVR